MRLRGYRPELRWVFSLAAVLVGMAAARPAEGYEGGAKRVILISVDGMTPTEYAGTEAGGPKIPNLAAMRGGGCSSPGVLGVFPASTYPNHTAMVTGEPPAVNGITTNVPLDPFGLEFGGWYYYAEKIKVPTLWSVLRGAGVRTAAVSWPVTVGAPVDLLLPEYRPVRTAEDVDLMHQISTPGLFQAAQAADVAAGKGAGESRAPDRPMEDAWRVRAVEEILGRPGTTGLVALHLSGLDEAQHKYGPHTPESHAEMERIDGEIGDLRRFVEEHGEAADTAWMVVSDHGFLPIAKQFNPMVALRGAGLITTDAAGKVTGWKVFVNNLTGSAFLVAKDPGDTASMAKATSLMEEMARDPANGIARLDTAADLKRMGAAPEAFLALEAAPGFGFGTGIVGPALGVPVSKGAHGYDPELPAMHSSLILYGAGVRRCSTLDGVRIYDIGPTAAGLLGVPMTGTEGRDVNRSGDLR